MADIRAIIFDFDGVIVESVDVKTWAFQELFITESPNVQREVVEYHKANGGISRMTKIKHIYEHFLRQPLSDDLFQKLCVRYSELVVEKVIACPFVPGALEFLDSCYQKFNLYVISGTPTEELKAIIKAKRLERFFQKVYGSPQTKTSAVEEILKGGKIPPAQVVFVGDALADHEAAFALGTYFVARVPEGEKSIFTGKKVHAQIKDLSNLDQIIRELKT